MTLLHTPYCCDKISLIISAFFVAVSEYPFLSASALISATVREFKYSSVSSPLAFTACVVGSIPPV
nr:MAG TPA: hypothetical protein [Caudoviricetes sp.]DAJ86767.1 MAG TPA: hypothetical protein [Caudoviricetes sp.]